MTKCYKCNKPIGVLSKTEYDGHIYCFDCSDKAKEQHKKEKKKQKNIIAEKKAMIREYKRNGKKLVMNRIKTWKRRNCKSELNCSKSLIKYLEEELTPPEIYIGPEHGLAMSKVDIVIGFIDQIPYRDFAIELKLDLKKSDFDRLKGQIHTYLEQGFDHIIIVLIGKTEARVETALRKYINDIECFKKYPAFYKFDDIEIIKKK